MTTRNPIEPNERDRQTTIDPAMPDAEDVLKNVEVPYGNTPDGVKQVNAVVSHPESGRRVRRMVVRDDNEQAVYDTEVGLVDGQEVFHIERGWAEYTDEPDMVYVPALDESMTITRYARLVGFDRPERKLGLGFDEGVRKQDDTAIL